MPSLRNVVASAERQQQRQQFDEESSSVRHADLYTQLRSNVDQGLQDLHKLCWVGCAVEDAGDAPLHVWQALQHAGQSHQRPSTLCTPTPRSQPNTCKLPLTDSSTCVSFDAWIADDCRMRVTSWCDRTLCVYNSKDRQPCIF